MGTYEEKMKALKSALTQIEKEFGKGTVMKMSEKPAINTDIISSGSLLLDNALGIGGYPKGRIVEMYGPESCIYKNTYIQYETRYKNGKRINHKGGTIEHLYELFHDCCKDGRANKLNREDIVFMISSINEDERIIKQVIADVVKTGVKECFKLLTKSGEEIIATAEHKFYIGNGNYKPLGDLSVGDTVYIHNNTHSKDKKHDHEFNRPEVLVKYHPSCRVKMVDKYMYYRVRESHIVYEAHLNGYTKDEFIKILNSKDEELINTLTFIDTENYDIHHKDLNPENNAIENLELLTKSEHYRLHATSNQKYLSFIAVEDEIVDIIPFGAQEVYDIKCFAPYNNYIANNFVVHNCGKTTMALHAIAECQKNGGIAAFIDAEHAMDPTYAKALGVDVDNMYICQPDCGEQALEVADKLVQSGAIDICVIDSVAALVPKKELEGDMGDVNVGLQARLMSQALRKLTASVSKNNCLMIFINQLREKVGIMFGNPETTTGK
jgi:RecA/RadA recombinase